jgi:hypothetical protein
MSDRQDSGDAGSNRSLLSQQFLVASVVGVQTLKAAAVDPMLKNQWEEKLASYVKTRRRYARDARSKRHPICQQDYNGDRSSVRSPGSHRR